MRRFSLNARKAQNAEASADVQVVLFRITHPKHDFVIRLSTDNTERLSTDPVMFGTRSTWQTADPEADPFLFVLAEALLPSDDPDAPAEGKVVLAALDAKYAEILRSFIEPAQVDMAVVMSSEPDVVIQEWRGLEIPTSEIANDQIVIPLTREDITLEYFPPGRMTRAFFPALHW